ncbi:MAG: inositol monophosphatase, partial [Chloroflexi bacterium]|nr:inositol monophosphatase [Chloroflexota bacterium]
SAVTRRSIAEQRIPSVFEELEETAYDLAVLAGEWLIDALGRQITVRYKDDERGIMAPHDAVSQVDEQVEALIRRRLAARHPDHTVLGEEGGFGGAPASRFTWTIDPVDGTTNFVNGLPLYASAIGVLMDGAPVAGAIWCAASHALRPGVYHAHAGWRLRFDGLELSTGGRTVLGRRRRVSTSPAPYKLREPGWDHRGLGAIALESAFVAAGLLASARSARARSWDVGPGVVLARAAGREVWTRGADRWEPFEAFDDAAAWSQPMLFGGSDAVTALRVGAIAI